MTGISAQDDSSFRRILARNITMPLVAGVVNVGVFAGILVYLLSVLTWVEHSERVIGSANETAKLMVDQESGLRGFALTGDETFLASYKLARPKMDTGLALLRELVADNPVQVTRVRNIEAQQRQWDGFAQGVIDLRRNGGDYLEPIRAGRGKLEFDEVRNLFQLFVTSEQRLLAERRAHARSVTRIAITAFVLASLVVSGLLAMFGRRDMRKLSDTYGKALQEQTAHAERLQAQAWLRTGQTQLAEQGIGQMALPQLSAALLQFLSHYVGVAAAALYVRDQDGSLQRTASYGYGREQEDYGAVLAPGEGLPWQAVQLRRVIQLDELPEDYLKISSGMGAAPPRHLLLAPVSSDGVVNGVVELAFLQPVSERQLEFIKLVSGNIGTAIEATLARQRIAEVLAETQQLNEELQVQQEELRTANEELEEQSRVLEESQASLENQKAELEQTNEQLSEQALVLDQKNEALGEAQQQLEERALDLERASQYKSQFLANMSHELRTPLNSSLILAKLLSENAQGNLDEEQVRFAQTIYSAGNDLLNLINDILDISKVEAGKLELAPEDLSVQQVVRGLGQVFEPLAQQKHLQFTVEVAPDVPQTIYTDRQRLEQILKNLLSNAIKFTEAGRIALRVWADPSGQLSFAVSDSGIGIRPDQHETIFGAFQQADGTTSRRYGGTGLGLSISRDLARLLGGTIELSSQLGKGSTFTLVLPAQWAAPAHGAGVVTPVQPSAAAQPASAVPPAAAQKAQAPAQAPAVAPDDAPPPVPRPFDDDRDMAPPPERIVLVVEDEPAFARILYDLAHEMGYRCVVAFAADEGLQLAEQYRPDAILLDIRLPDRSGLSVLQLLKDNPNTRHIPVHVVSASENAEAALHMGAIGFALKPATREQLEEVFHKLENKFTQKIKRLLLVEDDARQRDSVVALISDDDIDITAVESGEEALALLRTTIFDCMIIDLKLPDMQGNELLQRMAQEEIASFPPVIVYTGRNLTRAEEADLHKYSRSIIIKGARSPERLLDEVTLFLHKVESQLSSERQTMLKTVRSRDRVFEGRRILLVDDDVRNIFALTSALEQKGATVEIGRNGQEAIDKLDAVPDIDLVLMDVMMPVMDGLEATRRIRADGRFGRLPIIAITAKAMKDDQEQCLAAGANDYLAKPIDLSRLYSLLRVWMQP
ncbi:two-component system sensor histidine kinase/response regulator [Massilia sp. Root418]|uniref:response regulator n=1 Tax=Massilia sp. Root418 TaxID=1736532 RepID=UPI0006FA5C35|nr:response regulator [Massilia sp. Root418]KQW99963.1 two-component system sensor histidine kinase/response regulator [Massilia sp. Root418]